MGLKDGDDQVLTVVIAAKEFLSSAVFLELHAVLAWASACLMLPPLLNPPQKTSMKTLHPVFLKSLSYYVDTKPLRMSIEATDTGTGAKPKKILKRSFLNFNARPCNTRPRGFVSGLATPYISVDVMSSKQMNGLSCSRTSRRPQWQRPI
jgi:hypothetical protein